MSGNEYRNGEQISQKLFELTGDPRYHNMRVGFENLRREKDSQRSQTQMEDSGEGMGREM